MDTKDYAIFLATGKYITSVDFAFINWMMDKKSHKWSTDILDMFDIDISKLCDIELSTANLGTITEEFAQKAGLPSNIAVINGSGDLLTAAIGSGAIGKGKVTCKCWNCGLGWVSLPERKERFRSLCRCNCFRHA